DVSGTAQVHRSGLAMYAAAAQTTQVVGVDLQADAVEALGVDAQIARHRAEGFREHHRGTAVQNAVGLMGARIDHHAAADGMVVESIEADVEHLADGVLLLPVEAFEVRLDSPDTHGKLLDSKVVNYFTPGRNAARHRLRADTARSGSCPRQAGTRLPDRPARRSSMPARPGGCRRSAVRRGRPAAAGGQSAGCPDNERDRPRASPVADRCPASARTWCGAPPYSRAP